MRTRDVASCLSGLMALAIGAVVLVVIVLLGLRSEEADGAMKGVAEEKHSAVCIP